MSLTKTIRILLVCGMLLLASCGERSGDFGRPVKSRQQPVDLVLLENGRPDPAVLAAEQIILQVVGQGLQGPEELAALGGQQVGQLFAHELGLNGAVQ